MPSAQASLAPEITVVTPTKNRLGLLAETMDSVSAQAFQNWEHIVVDDGSDDGTAEALAERSGADPRVRYIPRQGAKAGANVCRNLGLEAAAAPLIVFLDSDDLLEPDCLGRRVAVMQRNQDLDFATFQTGVFVKAVGDLGRVLDAELIGDDLMRFLFFEAPWQTTSPVWRRTSLERLGGFDESLLSWQDIDLHVRALSAGFRYLRFPQVDHHMRWQFEPTKTSVLQHRSPAHLQGGESLVEKLEGVVAQGAGMTWVRQRAFCSLYFLISQNWVMAGDHRQAQRVWRKMRDRRLGSSSLYLSGAMLLWLTAAKFPTERLIRKWKGWMRLRTQPDILPERRD
jgi:hypothetical protein